MEITKTKTERNIRIYFDGDHHINVDKNGDLTLWRNPGAAVYERLDGTNLFGDLIPITPIFVKRFDNFFSRGFVINGTGYGKSSVSFTRSLPVVGFTRKGIRIIIYGRNEQSIKIERK